METSVKRENTVNAIELRAPIETFERTACGEGCPFVLAEVDARSRAATLLEVAW